MRKLTPEEIAAIELHIARNNRQEAHNIILLFAARFGSRIELKTVSGRYEGYQFFGKIYCD